MSTTTFLPPSRKSLTLNLTWVLASILFAVTVENVWVDPWLHWRFPDIPSLVPEPPSPFWIATFSVMGIACVVLLVGQILLMRRAGVSRQSKIVAGLIAAGAISLSILWFCVTAGIAPPPHL